MAAQRYSAMGGGGKSGPGDWVYDYLFAPGGGKGFKSDPGSGRGDVKEHLTDPLSLIQGGSDKYGLTHWNKMFGDGGEILDQNALLRSLNLGSVMGQGPTFSNRRLTGSGEHRQEGFGYDVNDPLQEWLMGISQEGGSRGRSGAIPGGEWIPGFQHLGGRKRTRREGAYYDPSSLRFGAEDIAGMETLDDLEAWAQENFGVDAMTLAASSPELLETRQAWYDDPSQFWDMESGMLDVSEIPGLDEISMNARLGGFADEMGLRQDAQARQLQGGSEDLYANLMMRNPHLGRTSVGQMVEAMAPRMSSLPGVLQGMTPQYPGFDFGLQQAMAPYLEDANYGRARYGG